LVSCVHEDVKQFGDIALTNMNNNEQYLEVSEEFLEHKNFQSFQYFTKKQNNNFLQK